VFTVGRPEFQDARGSFSKVVGEGDWVDEDPFVSREVFWSRSNRGVFRGMHLQLPPHDGRKLVFVVAGTIRDFVVDLRVGSPTERRVLEVPLDEHSGGLLIPEGCAHGFEALTDDSIVVYGQEDFHSPEHDSGVLYSSVGIELASARPVISQRDCDLPPLDSFESPFTFG
jgi:dTDP-4-dehydrorhamnose 3,5-epimerase